VQCRVVAPERIVTRWAQAATFGLACALLALAFPVGAEAQALSGAGCIPRRQKPWRFDHGIVYGSTAYFPSGSTEDEQRAAMLAAPLTVVGVICGSPAARAGLREGDELLTVNGKDVHTRNIMVPTRDGEVFVLHVRRASATLVFKVRCLRSTNAPPGGG